MGEERLAATASELSVLKGEIDDLATGGYVALAGKLRLAVGSFRNVLCIQAPLQHASVVLLSTPCGHVASVSASEPTFQLWGEMPLDRPLGLLRTLDSYDGERVRFGLPTNAFRKKLVAP